MATEGYPLIAVVEDDLDLRTIYTEILSHNGFETIGYPDGRSALDAIAAGSVKPRMIVLDYMLPGNMNGEMFVQELACRPGAEKLPIILVSALSGEVKEIAHLKSHPWIVSFFNKGDIAANKLVDFIKAYFGLS
jgi:two-component system CheB/CheR fusion protein